MVRALPRVLSITTPAPSASLTHLPTSPKRVPRVSPTSPAPPPTMSTTKPPSADPTDDPEAYAEVLPPLLSRPNPANPKKQRLKAALWYHIGQLVDSEAIELEANATPQFIGALTELVWSQVENVAHDLESFAK